LNNLGRTYETMGEYKLARDCYTERLSIAETLGDVRGVASGMGNLGKIYLALDSVDSAIKYLEGGLERSEKISYRDGEILSLTGLGDAYKKMQDLEQSKIYYYKALAIAQKNGLKFDEGNIFWQISQLLYQKGDLMESSTYAQKALRILKRINSVIANDVEKFLQKLVQEP